MELERWQKVKKLYEAALRQPPNKRPSFLDEQCGDEELRREVESLLSFSSDAGNFLENPAVREIADIIVSDNEKLESGKAFGHYEIIKQIGAGGMGEVYLAQDKRLDRRVAVKILNEKFAQDKSNLQRFIREAKSASALNHPNILTVHEVGVSDETHYIVSEFIKGKTLRERIKESPLSLAEILDVAIQASNALNAAHEANLVHRDIKPENVMIRPDGFVKVLDFGLAKLVEQKNKTILGFENSTVQQNPTAKGVILGTINYMSPEQTRGLEIDARTDIWSLGVVLYEMVTGRTPFASDTMSDTMSAILNKNPAPISASVPDIPKELERIVGKTLRKNRDERYQHIKDLLIDLKDCKQELEFSEKLERSGTPSKNEKAASVKTEAVTEKLQVQTTSSAEYIVGKISSNKRAAALTFGSVILLALIGIGFWYFFNRSSSVKQIESIAVMPFVNASSSSDVEYLSDGMTETLIKSLSNLPNLNVKPRSSVFRYKGKDTDLQTIAKELNVQAILNGRIAQRGDALTLSLELVDVQKDSVIWSESYNRKQSDLVALQSEIARDVLTNLKTKLSGADEQKVAKFGTTDPEAYQLYLKGRHQWNKATGESLKQAVEYYRQAIEKDPNFALAYSGLAEAYVQFGGYNVAPAEDSMPLAKAAALRALEIDESSAEVHAALGYYLMLYEFDLDRSEKQFRRAIELKPDYAIAHQGYSQNLTVVKRFDEALAEIRLAEQLDPLSPDIGTDVGAVLVFARRYDEAIVQLKRTLVRDPNFSRGYSYLGWAYGSKGMYAEAVAAARKALELSDSYFIKAYLAFWLGKSGNRDEALKILAELEKAASEGYVRPSAMAVVYIGLGDKDKALNQLEKEVSSRSFNAIYLAVLPDVDDLRSEPRFKAMLKRMNLPE